MEIELFRFDVRVGLIRQASAAEVRTGTVTGDDWGGGPAFPGRAPSGVIGGFDVIAFPLVGGQGVYPHPPGGVANERLGAALPLGLSQVRVIFVRAAHCGAQHATKAAADVSVSGPSVSRGQPEAGCGNEGRRR